MRPLAPDTRHVVRTAAASSVVLAFAAFALWLGSIALATKDCLEEGYGLGVEGGGMGMTERGCQITVPTTSMGLITSDPMPSHSDGAVTAAMVAATLIAVPPFVGMWVLARRKP